jgi:hypothetical protein
MKILDIFLKNLKIAIQHRADLISRGYWTPTEMEETDETIRQLERQIGLAQQHAPCTSPSDQ